MGVSILLGFLSRFFRFFPLFKNAVNFKLKCMLRINVYSSTNKHCENGTLSPRFLNNADDDVGRKGSFSDSF